MRAHRLRGLSSRMALIAILTLVPTMAVLAGIAVRQHEVARGEVLDEKRRLAHVLAREQSHIFVSARRQVELVAADVQDHYERQSDCAPVLRDLVRLKQGFVDAIVVAPDGTVVCSGRPLAEKVDMADRQWFQAAVATRDFAVSDLLTSRVSGIPILAVAQPVVDAEERVLAVVAFGLDLETLAANLADVQMPPGSAVTLVDRRGSVLARWPEHSAWVGRSVSEAPFYQSVLEHGEGAGEGTGPDGIDRLYAVAPVQGPAGALAYLSVDMPAQLAYGSIDRAFALALAGVGIIGLLALGVSRYVSGKLVFGPVSRLVHAARRLAGGDLQARSGVSGVGGELGELAAAFDVMAESLETREQALARAEAEYRGLVENLPAVTYVAVFPLHSPIEYVSPQLANVAGIDPSAWLADPDAWRHSIHPLDRPRVDDDLLRSFRAGRPFTSEYRLLSTDGREVWVQDQATKIADLGAGRVLCQGVLLNVTDRKRAQAVLEHQALHDPLTNLPNRTLLFDRIDQALRRARRQGGSIGLLLLDLDRFKEVNDALGHPAGDQLLCQVAERLRDTIREQDTVARLSGDEFAIVLPETNANGSADAAQRILEALNPPFVLDEHPLRASASLGIALGPEHGDQPPTLLRHADVAMYAAKRMGGSVFTLYVAERDAASAGRLLLETELQQAIDEDQLVLHYQPKVHLRSGSLAGVEALVRWQHPGRGLIPPGEFIPLAEHTGLVKPLGLWVLRTALNEHLHWRDAGYVVPVAVNLSMHHLHDPDVVSSVAMELERTKVGPGMLILEVTESALMRERAETIRTLEQLRSLNVRISVDDFGTGYSSLGYLKHLPVDELKIDRSFVRGISTDQRDLAIVRSIVELGHSLGLVVTAEGVEDSPTLEHLTSLGCDTAQGYFLALPQPQEQIWSLMQQYQPTARTPAPEGAQRTTATTASRAALLSAAKHPYPGAPDPSVDLP